MAMMAIWMAGSDRVITTVFTFQLIPVITPGITEGITVQYG